MTGFLFSEEVVADGSPNAGIKDMIKVLEWIQEHISKCKHMTIPFTVPRPLWLGKFQTTLFQAFEQVTNTSQLAVTQAG